MNEEKKAIEYLKIEYEKLMKEDNICFPLYKSDAKRLIDIIEKQSKEIEILNKNMNLLREQNISYKQSIYGLKEMNNLCNKKWKDKIKAKIEEIEEEKRHYLEINDEYNAQICDCIIEEYESLLEKE